MLMNGFRVKCSNELCCLYCSIVLSFINSCRSYFNLWLKFTDAHISGRTPPVARFLWSFILSKLTSHFTCDIMYKLLVNIICKYYNHACEIYRKLILLHCLHINAKTGRMKLTLMSVEVEYCYTPGAVCNA